MAISQQISLHMEKASWIRKMFEQGRELTARYGAENVFDFTLGNPVAEPPAAFCEALRRAVEDPQPGKHRYMPNVGYPEVRRKIATALAKEHDVPLTERHLVMTTGAASALNVALKALLDPEDEVIILAPFFVEYLFYVPNHGGTPLIVDTDEDFQISLPRIEAALTPKTKAIILNSPNNPTGVIYRETDLRALAALLERHEQATGRTVYVISDEPYRRLVYDGATVPSTLGIFQNSIFCTSHAKDLSIPGERIGYLAIHPDCADADRLIDACAFTIRILGFVNAPALMQRTVADLQQVSIDVDLYRKKRDLFYDGLRDAGYECIYPQGAFYLFPRTPIPDDVAFVNTLMQERVLAVPGSGFGRQGYFRLAYCVSDETIRRALPAFRKALNG